MTENPMEQRTNPPIRFLRLPEVLERTGLSRNTIYVRPRSTGGSANGSPRAGSGEREPVSASRPPLGSPRLVVGPERSAPVR